MKLQNTGQLTLTSVAATSNLTYMDNNCSSVTTLGPGQSVDCVLTATATQDDYDAGTLVLSVGATAQHSGYSALTWGGTLSYSSWIALNNSASMDLVVYADPAAVAAEGVHSRQGWSIGNKKSPGLQLNPAVLWYWLVYGHLQTRSPAGRSIIHALLVASLDICCLG